MSGEKMIKLLLLSAASLGLVCSRSTGPPLSPDSDRDLVCEQMTPNPINHGDESNGNGGYVLEISPPMVPAANGFTYSNNTVYTVRITGGTLRGFLMQARMPGNDPGVGVTPMLLGSFQTGATSQQTLNCDLPAGAATEATISHSENLNDADSAQFTWTAPDIAGDVDFYYTVVRVRTTHFDALKASDVGVTTPSPDGGPTTEPQAITRPPGLTTPVRAPEDYRLQVTSPDGCSLADCDLFIGIDTNTGNTEYLDIFMEGNAAGWVAVGFSNTQNMFLADVVSCNRLGDDIVPIDGWNPASPTRASSTDTIRDVFPHNASFNSTSTRLSCTVSKSIAPSGTGEDLDLTNSLFVIFARRVSTSTQLNSLSSHAVDGTAVRGSSAMRFAIAADNGTAGGSVFDTVHRPNLIRAHGILMIIAWPLLAVTALFFAYFMRPALPNGEWFQVHRALLIISLFITTIAFVLIFVALKDNGGLVDTSNRTSLAHMVIGIVVLALQALNPIIALFRCKPDDRRRWIFRMFHGSFIGNSAQTLAFVNVALGLSLFARVIQQVSVPTQASLWVMVGWEVFYVVLIITMAITLAVYAAVTKQKCCGCAPSTAQTLSKEKNDFEMKPSAGEKAEEDEVAIKSPSKDSPLRWGFLAFFFGVTIPVMIAVIVMVAVP